MIVSKKVQIRLNNQIKGHYIDLGYDFENIPGTKPGGETPIVEVDVEDLPKYSTAEIKVICDFCGNEYITKKLNVTKGRKIVPKDCCSSPGCKAIKTKETTKAKYGVTNVMHLSSISEKISGENHYNHNPGRTQEERIRARHNKGVVDWRVSVFERDEYTCNLCGRMSTEGDSVTLVSHHLNSYDRYPSQRLDVDNGATLCDKCHLEFHKFYGFGDNTKEQYKEYKMLKGKTEEELQKIKEGNELRVKNSSLSRRVFCEELDIVFGSATQAAQVLTGNKRGAGNIIRGIEHGHKIYGNTWRHAKPGEEYSKEGVIKLNKEIKKIKNKPFKRKCRCVELNIIFESVSDAHEHFGVKRTDSKINKAISNGKKAFGYHWEYTDALDKAGINL